MKRIEIVSHCWSGQFPHYAAALNYQISSLLIDKPKSCRVGLAICCTSSANDPNTNKVVRWAWSQWLYHTVPFFLPIEELGRRSIGRNTAALESTADIVWFADCDQVFRDGILDRLAALEWPDDAVMIHPREIMIHKDHVTGDEATAAVDLDNPSLVEIDPSDFVPKQYNRAIGGVQIVRGDFAREHGYLRGDPKWQSPAAKPFGDFRDDVAYRQFCSRHGKIVGVDLPGLYRLRHTWTTYQ